MKKKALQNVQNKCDVRIPNTQKKRLVARGRERERERERDEKDERGVERAIELQNFFFFYLLRCITLPPSLTHEARRPAVQRRLPILLNYYYYYYVVVSSSSKHAPCCGRFPVALLPVGVFFHVCVLKRRRRLCLFVRVPVEARVFLLSLSYASFLKVTSLVVVVVFSSPPLPSSSPPSLSLLPRLFPRFPSLSRSFLRPFRARVLSASRRPLAPQTSGTFSSLPTRRRGIRSGRNSRGGSRTTLVFVKVLSLSKKITPPQKVLLLARSSSLTLRSFGTTTTPPPRFLKCGSTPHPQEIFSFSFSLMR